MSRGTGTGFNSRSDMGRVEPDQDAVLDVLEARRADINAAIEDDLPIADPDRLYKASRYLLEAGGKRLRPTLLLLIAESLVDREPGSVDYRAFPTLDGAQVDIMKAAVSIEVIQSFTLIHDDIMDDDDLRRGVPAVHREFDLETAILAGDTLYSKAFEIMLQTGATPERSIRALRVLAETCTRICEGQSLDLKFETSDVVTVPEYRDMIERKTAVLFRAAAAVPAILLGADDETIESLGNYGLGVGEAFQIHDDVLDLTASSETLGKDRGSDLVEGKRTLITLHAERNGVDIESIRPSEPTPDAIESAVAELEAAGSIAFAQSEAEALVEDALEELAVLPENTAHRHLTELARYLVEREY